MDWFNCFPRTAVSDLFHVLLVSYSSCLESSSSRYHTLRKHTYTIPSFWIKFHPQEDRRRAGKNNHILNISCTFWPHVAEDTLRICSDPPASIVVFTGPRLTTIGTSSPTKGTTYEFANVHIVFHIIHFYHLNKLTLCDHLYINTQKTCIICHSHCTDFTSITFC